jgi:hypothetical protein
MSDSILDAIERIKKQEEGLLSDVKESINHWHGSLLIFAGLAMAVLSNQKNTWAYLLIVFWLVEALLAVYPSYTDRKIYDLMIIRHFEGTISEEQEYNDLKYAERKHKQAKIFEKYASKIFFALTFLTGVYFIVKILFFQFF